MEQNPNVNFTVLPDGAQADQQAEIVATANTGIYDATVDSQVYITFEIFVDNSRVARDQFGAVLQDELVDYSITHPFGSGDHQLRVDVEVNYFDSDGFDSLQEATASDSATITIEQRTFTGGGGDADTVSPQQPLDESYSDFVGFEIRDINSSDTGPTPEGGVIQFEYPNPAIGVDTGGNFVSHEIIGGATVRQRIGDQPLEIDVSGVCTEETAAQIELLRNAENGLLYSSRFSDDSVRVHFASLSTSPMEDGGAADMKTGQFLYTFDLSCVEILDTGDSNGN